MIEVSLDRHFTLIKQKMKCITVPKMEFNCLNISAVLQHTGKTTTMNFSLSDLLVQINFPRYRRHHGTCLHLTDPEIEDRFHWKDTKYTTKNSNAPSSITESMKSSPSIPILNKTESSKRHFRPVVAVNVVRSKAESPRWKFFPSHLTVNIACNSKWLAEVDLRTWKYNLLCQTCWTRVLPAEKR